jgi:hypothetical protein
MPPTVRHEEQLTRLENTFLSSRVAKKRKTLEIRSVYLDRALIKRCGIFGREKHAPLPSNDLHRVKVCIQVVKM